MESVAVHSDADADAKHVREADLAVPIGEAPATASYLNAPVLVRAALDTGAEAVHPGYGFLSESPPFAAAVLDSGLAWVGPEPKVLELTGDKVAAREAFHASEFPVLPGAGPFFSADQARAAVAELGYPLMVKAVMGGGGIGMSVAGDHDALEAAVDSASSRGARFFADASVYLERYVEPARHVEVQILADDHRTVHLSERECSVQRRHQKVIEETPSPALDADLRRRMCQAAVRSMESIGYRGAGTVECIVTPDREFFFLEVNARIQVEHPVTEVTAGVDLVAEQLRIAAGAGMSFETTPGSSGYAIESRVYAEDPDRFLPSPGRIDTLRLPEGARCDFGYDQGDEVPMFYDPLVGKVVVTADSRSAAIEEMRRALEALVIDGPKTNVAAHLRVLGDQRFQSGEYDTGLLGA
jgi:acetyl-CoA carboxylase, biotin carboxylase subunit